MLHGQIRRTRAATCGVRSRSSRSRWGGKWSRCVDIRAFYQVRMSWTHAWASVCWDLPSSVHDGVHSSCRPATMTESQPSPEILHHSSHSLSREEIRSALSSLPPTKAARVTDPGPKEAIFCVLSPTSSSTSSLRRDVNPFLAGSALPTLKYRRSSSVGPPRPPPPALRGLPAAVGDTGPFSAHEAHGVIAGRGQCACRDPLHHFLGERHGARSVGTPKRVRYSRANRSP